jgi:hypothetical protein
MIEANRRDAGELVPVSEVQTFISSVITYIHVVLVSRAESLTNEILGKNDPLEVYRQLRRAFDEAQVTGVFGYIKGGKSPDQRLVTFAEQCVRGQFAHYKSTGLFDHAEQTVVQLIRWAQEQP